MALRDQFAAQLGVNNPAALPQQKPPPLKPLETPEQPSEFDEMGAFEKAMDVLNRGAAASAGAAHALITGKNPFGAAWDGLAGHERKNYSDVLGAVGMDQGLARAVLGMGADVALDPTTYLTFGTGAGEKVAVRGVEKTLTEGAGVARKLSEVDKGQQAVRILNRLDDSGRTALKGSLLERYGLGKYADMANQPVGKVMGERATAEGLGRVAEGKPVSGALSELQGSRLVDVPLPKSLSESPAGKFGPGFDEHISGQLKDAQDVVGSLKPGRYELTDASGSRMVDYQGGTHAVSEAGDSIDLARSLLHSAGTDLTTGERVWSPGAKLRYVKPASPAAGKPVFQQPTIRWAGMPLVAPETMQKGVQAVKNTWNAAEGTKTIGPILKGVRQGGEDVGKYLKSLFSASTGNAELDELRAGSRDTLDYSLYKKVDEYMGKGGIAEHMNELKKGDPKVYEDAQRQVRGYLEGVSDIKKRDIPDLEKERLVDSKMGLLAGQLQELKLQQRAAGAQHAAKIDVVKGQMQKGSLDYLEAQGQHETAISKAAEQEAKEQTQLLKDQHEIAYGDLKRELRSRGVGQVSGISKDEYQNNIPRQYRRKAGLGMDQWIDELKTRGKLGPEATETEFYDLIRKAHTPPGSVNPEAMVGGVKSESTAARITQLEAEAVARKKELAELTAKNPGKHFDPKIAKIEKEIAELKAQPKPMKTETYGVKRLPEDPKLAKLAQDLEARMEKVHGAEQKLPLPPEHRENYFPHQLRDDIRPAIRKAISQDAYKAMRKEYAAGLGSSQRRTYEGLVGDISVQHLIDAGHIDPDKLKEILEKQGIKTTPNMMLAFEQDPVKVALGRELSSIRSLNRVDFAHEILANPHFMASKVKLGDRANIVNTLAQNPGHALYIPSATYIQHFMDKGQQEALRKGGSHGKAMNLIEEVFAHQLPDLVQTPAQHVAEGYILRKEVAEHLSKAYSNQFSEEATRNFLKLWDKGTNYFKTFQTLTNPGFYTRNMVSYMWQAGILAGAHDPATWGKAALAMKDPSKVSQIGKYSGAEIMEFMKRNGIFRQGYISQDLTDTLDRMLNPSKNPLSMSGPIARHGGDLVQNIDNWARVALTFDGVEKGMDLQSAIMRTKKYLFDMGDFSKTEKQFFKRLIPFYSWTRKSIPLALESMVTQPGKVSVLGKIQREAESNVDGALDQKYVSEFIRDNMGVPISKGADGKINYFLMGRWIPTADVQRLDPKEMFSMLHPLIKEPIEQAMNYNVFSGKAISRFPGEIQKFTGIDMNARIAHLARNVGVLQQLDRTFFRNDLDVVQTPLNTFGLTTYGQDKAAQMKRSMNDVNHEIGELKAAQASMQAKYGDDSGVTQQYVQRIANLQAENQETKDNLAKVESQLGTMQPGAGSHRRLTSNPIVQKLQKAAGLKHKAISPKIAKILHSSGKGR